MALDRTRLAKGLAQHGALVARREYCLERPERQQLADQHALVLGGKPADSLLLAVPFVFEKLYAGAQQKAADANKGKIFALASATAITVTPGQVVTAVNATMTKISALKALTTAPVPTIAGTAVVGSTLTATAGTWAPATVSGWTDGSTVDLADVPGVVVVDRFRVKSCFFNFAF